MKTTFCRRETLDKLRLPGLFFEPDAGARAAVLHIHGRAGNFYANAFLDNMAQVYTEAGFAFLTVNTRGHGQISDFRVGETPEIKRIGSAFEIFEECVLDIGAWIDFLKEKGCEKIILQGYSQGAAKAVYYLNKNPCPEAAALILASPPDVRGLLMKYDKNGFLRDLKTAQKMILEGKGDVLMPNKIRDWYYISAGTLINECGEGSAGSVFPIFENGDYSALESIKIPILAFYGEKEDIVINSPRQDLEILKPYLANPKSKTLVIRGADHTYFKCEEKIADSILDWLKSIILTKN